MESAIKQIAVFAVVVIGFAAWTMRDAPRMAEASASKASGAQPSIRAEYAQRLHDNEPLRSRLAQKYPDTYRDLASQVHRDLNGCIVTEVVPGVLKATCQQ
jgi:hypothetical protein